MSRPIDTTALMLWIVLAAHAFGQAPVAVGALRLPDSTSRNIDVLPTPKGELTVLIFVRPSCPITDAYAPQWNALAHRFADHKVRFFQIVAGENDGESVRTYVTRFAITTPVLIDAAGAGVESLAVDNTAECFVIDDGQRVRYRGRLDDRWTSRTQKREVRVRDLAAAIEAVSAGHEPAEPRTKSFGCLIERAADSLEPTPYTFHRDVEPLLRRHCIECHRAGEVAPLSFETFEEVRGFARDIAAVTQIGYMPPWKACGPRDVFIGDRRLADAEKSMLQSWAKGGAPRGDPAGAPPKEKFVDGWLGGEPDHVVAMNELIELSAAGEDEYHWIVLPTGLEADQYLKSVEYRPEPRASVHHLIALVDVTGKARELDAADPGLGYRRFGDPGFVPHAAIGVWAPGATPHRLPDGYARELPKGADIVLQVHCRKTGRAAKVGCRIGLHFAREKVERVVFTVGYGPLDIRIPAGAPEHGIDFSLIVPTRTEILAVGPHMHFLGRVFDLAIESPQGERTELIHIDDWDFNWQLPYVFRTPVMVPSTSKLLMRGIFDNSAANPVNPNHPPRLVVSGPESTDEMLVIFMDVSLPDDPMLERVRKLFPTGGR